MHVVSRLLAPLARTLVEGEIPPNVMTTAAALIVGAAGAMLGAEEIRFGGVLLLSGGLLDVLAGEVARRAGAATAFGAFYGATLARVGESALFAGLAVYFVNGGVPAARAGLGVALAVAALATSLLASYARARAEGLGVDCPVGFAGRAERLFVFGAALVAFGAGPDGALALWLVAALALAAAVTLIQRVLHVARAAGTAPPPPAKRDTLPGVTAARRKAL